MLTLKSGPDAKTAIIDYFSRKGGSLPELTRQKMLEAIASSNQAENIVFPMEALYAASSSLDDEGKELVAALAEFVAEINLWSLGADGRADGIRVAMHRELGVAPPPRRNLSDPEKDPAPDDRFIEPPEEPDASEEPDAPLPPSPDA
jgi:hypothetical protein